MNTTARVFKSISFDSRLMDLVNDFALYHDRDRLSWLCLDVAKEFDVDDTEVMNDVDLLYQEEFGDIYE